MKCICPECKNQIDLTKYPNLKVKYVIECNTCGMTLEVVSIESEEVKTEIVDEGK
jgi:lysine biosynthesis protein LysW